MSNDRLHSPSQAATIMDVTRTYVLQLYSQGRLQGTVEDGQLGFSDADIAAGRAGIRRCVDEVQSVTMNGISSCCF